MLDGQEVPASVVLSCWGGSAGSSLKGISQQLQLPPTTGSQTAAAVSQLKSALTAAASGAHPDSHAAVG